MDRLLKHTGIEAAQLLLKSAGKSLNPLDHTNIDDAKSNTVCFEPLVKVRRPIDAHFRCLDWRRFETKYRICNFFQLGSKISASFFCERLIIQKQYDFAVPFLFQKRYQPQNIFCFQTGTCPLQIIDTDDLITYVYKADLPYSFREIAYLRDVFAELKNTAPISHD